MDLLGVLLGILALISAGSTEAKSPVEPSGNAPGGVRLRADPADPRTLSARLELEMRRSGGPRKASLEALLTQASRGSSVKWVRELVRLCAEGALACGVWSARVSEASARSTEDSAEVIGEIHSRFEREVLLERLEQAGRCSLYAMALTGYARMGRHVLYSGEAAERGVEERCRAVIEGLATSKAQNRIEWNNAMSLLPLAMAKDGGCAEAVAMIGAATELKDSRGDAAKAALGLRWVLRNDCRVDALRKPLERAMESDSEWLRRVRRAENWFPTLLGVVDAREGTRLEERVYSSTLAAEVLRAEDDMVKFGKIDESERTVSEVPGRR